MKNNKLKIEGINENNLKNIDFVAELGEVITVRGVSGSGKSTLVNNVIASEAIRQSKIRRKSDDLYDYCIRANFRTVSDLPEVSIISQRGVYTSKHSTLGTRTKLNELLIKLFVSHGEIIHNGKKLQRPTCTEAITFKNTHYPESKLLFAIARFEEISSQTLSYLRKYEVQEVILRRFGDSKLRLTSFSKLKNIQNIDDYEVFIDEVQFFAEKINIKTKWKLFLIDEQNNINLHEHALSQDDGHIFRLPSTLLFSRSTQSSLAGYCTSCNGKGDITEFHISSLIFPNVHLESGFLNVPLTASGRYQGLKFLPSGLVKLLKNNGIDVKCKWSELTAEHKDATLRILLDKLESNKNDVFVQKLIRTTECTSCCGTGLSNLARAVTFEGKSIDFYSSLSPLELLKVLDGISNEITRSIKNISKYLDFLALGHIQLYRTTEQLSSGERQRIKLLPLLVNKVRDRVFVVDEPSSNLQYKDNLKILRVIREIQNRNNCIIIVDHNPMYQFIANRVLEIGPGAGVNGGKIQWLESADLNLLKFEWKEVKKEDKQEWLEIGLKPCRNIRISRLMLPKDKLSVVVGASGTGKTTLCRDMILPALNQSGVSVELIDSSPIHGGKRSIVATWIDVFDKIRETYSKNSLTQQPASVFSFNSQGACNACGGEGTTADEQICSVCFGERFRSDVLLETVDQLNISVLLGLSVESLPIDQSFYFLYDVVKIFKALSLSHISLGRATSTLSGGELQRLKIAKLLLRYASVKETIDRVFLLDEPSQGLDAAAVILLVDALKNFLPASTLIAVEHNPNFIYNCDFIVDLGMTIGEKNNTNINSGFLFEAEGFPSLNHNQVLDYLNSIKVNPLVNDAESDIHIDDNEKKISLNTKRLNFIPDYIIEQKNFEFEKIFSEKFKVKGLGENFFIYRNKKLLKYEFVDRNEFYFNPFISYLERFEILPKSIKQQILKDTKNNKVVCDTDEWNYVLQADSFEEAWVKGGGVLIEKIKYGLRYHSLRLFHPDLKIIDRLKPHKFAFNQYKNSCAYCKGYGYIQSYPLQKWLNNDKSILDKGVMSFPIEKVMPKSTIKHFIKEGLFDFTKKLKELSKTEKLILLYGFKAYKFSKNSRKSTEDDFYEWRGVNSYLYQYSRKLSPNSKLDSKIEWIECPFCLSGFNKKIEYYEAEGKNFIELINGY